MFPAFGGSRVKKRSLVSQGDGELQGWWGNWSFQFCLGRLKSTGKELGMRLMLPSKHQTGGFFPNNNLNPAKPVGKSLVLAGGNKILDVNKTCHRSLSANSPLGSLYTKKITQHFVSTVYPNA